MNWTIAFLFLVLTGCTTAGFNQVMFGSDHAWRESARDAISRNDAAGLYQSTLDEARIGNHQAIFALGVLTEKGVSVPSDTTAAIGYYSLAAKMGNADARLALARLGKPIPLVDAASGQSSQGFARGLQDAAGILSPDVFNAQRGVPPPAKPPPTYNTSCMRDALGNVSCTSRPSPF